jgi:hypothetical protein
MFKVISLIIVSGLIGYLGGIAQMHHYGLQKYLEGLDDGYGNAKKVIEAYKAGKRKCEREDVEIIKKVMNGEKIEFEDSE